MARAGGSHAAGCGAAQCGVRRSAAAWFRAVSRSAALGVVSFWRRDLRAILSPPLPVVLSERDFARSISVWVLFGFSTRQGLDPTDLMWAGRSLSVHLPKYSVFRFAEYVCRTCGKDDDECVCEQR